MNRRKSWFLAVLLLAILLAGIVFLLWPARGPDLSRIHPDLLERETVGEFDPDQLPELLSYRFLPGKMYRYSFNRHVHAARDSEQFLDLSLSGNLDIHAIDRRGRDLDLIVVLEVQQMGGVDGATDSDSALPYHNAVYISLAADGRPTALKFPAAMQESERQQMINDLSANFFKVLPEPGHLSSGQLLSGNSYRIESRDTHGHYTASLRVLAEKNPVPMNIAKEKYIRSYTPVVVENSDQSVAWNALKGYPLAIESREVLLVGPAEFQVRSEQSADYFLSEVTDSAYGREDLLAFIHASDIYQDEWKDLKSKELAAGMELSLEEARIRLATVQNQEEKEKHGTFRDLTVTFLRSPATATALIGEAGRFPSQSDPFQMILGAASYAASKEAQQALRDLFRTNLDEFGRQSILEAFTLMDRPMNQETIDFLNRIFRERGELSTSAGLALGNALRNEENQEARSSLEAEWHRARSDAERQTVLDFIGNSGDESFFPFVEEAMRGSVSLQRKAVYSVRFMEGQRVRDFLLNALRSAADAGVRERAATAISFQLWDDAFMPALASCVEKENLTGLRIKCADAALGEASRADNMRSLLSRLATSGDADWQEYVQVQLRK